MNRFYSKLISNPDDLVDVVVDAYDHYMAQYEAGRKEMDDLVGSHKTLFNASSKIPGIWAYRYAQLQEIEQIMGFIELREKRLLGIKRRHYREHYARELTDAMVERYAESDAEVLDLAQLRNMFAVVRNKFLALTKNHESLHFQLNNLTRLRAEGVTDATFEAG